MAIHGHLWATVCGELVRVWKHYGRGFSATKRLPEQQRGAARPALSRDHRVRRLRRRSGLQTAARSTWRSGRLSLDTRTRCRSGRGTCLTSSAASGTGGRRGGSTGMDKFWTPGSCPGTTWPGLNPLRCNRESRNLLIHCKCFFRSRQTVTSAALSPYFRFTIWSCVSHMKGQARHVGCF